MVSECKSLRPIISLLPPSFSMDAETSATSSVIDTLPSRHDTKAVSNSTNYDSIPMVIYGHKLSDNNYLSWSKSIEMFITGKGKEGYLFDILTPPATNDPKYKYVMAS